MSTQQKSSGGGRKNKSVAGQKDVTGVAVSEQINSQTQTNSKKHNNVNSKDAANNNAADQPKPEKEKQHVKVRNSSFLKNLRKKDLSKADRRLR